MSGLYFQGQLAHLTAWSSWVLKSFFYQKLLVLSYDVVSGSEI